MAAPKVTVKQVADDFTYVLIDFPEWEHETDDCEGRARPKGIHVVVNGCPIHLEGIEVGPGPEGFQSPVNDVWDSEYESLLGVYEPDGPYATATIDGREYVIYATPHGE